MITLLVSPRAFEDETVETVEVTGDAYQHLFRARRTAVGEAIRVVDGQGRARWSQVESVDRRRALLRLREPAAANEPAVEIHLLVAAPRPQRATWLVEKVTELGATRIAFLNTERAPRASNLDRLERVAIAALEQCHRARLPTITGPHPFAEIPSLVEGCPRRLVLDTGGTETRRQAGDASAAALAVGPEGGWSDAERQFLQEWGFEAVSLGPRVLRIETAAVVGVGILAR